MKTKENSKVFIVDDDEMYSKTLERYLWNEIPGIEVVTFPTGEACLFSIYKEPDVIFLDYLLNSEFPYAWSGLEIFRKIKQKTPYIPVVIISSNKDADTVMKFLDEGVAEYVTKNAEAFEKIKNIIVHLKEEEKEEEISKKEEVNFFKIALAIILIFLCGIFVSFFLMKM